MTTWYGAELFLHVVGAFGFFIALGLEWAAVDALRGSRDLTDARRWLGVFGDSQRIGLPSFLMLLIPGLYMSFFVIGWRPWNTVSIVALAAIALAWAGLTATRMPDASRAVASGGAELADRARALLGDTVLRASVRFRLALSLGIAFQMTAKPELPLALGSIAVATAIGIAAGFSDRSLPLPRATAAETRSN